MIFSDMTVLFVFLIIVAAVILGGSVAGLVYLMKRLGPSDATRDRRGPGPQ